MAEVPLRYCRDPQAARYPSAYALVILWVWLATVLIRNNLAYFWDIHELGQGGGFLLNLPVSPVAADDPVEEWGVFFSPVPSPDSILPDDGDNSGDGSEQQQ